MPRYERYADKIDDNEYMTGLEEAKDYCREHVLDYVSPMYIDGYDNWIDDSNTRAVDATTIANLIKTRGDGFVTPA